MVNLHVQYSENNGLAKQTYFGRNDLNLQNTKPFGCSSTQPEVSFKKSVQESFSSHRGIPVVETQQVGQLTLNKEGS